MFSLSWKGLRDVLAYEPALAAFAVNGGLALVLGSLVHISSFQEAAVTTIATAVVSVYTAVRTRKVSVSVLTGALTTALVAAGAFGLHWSAQEIGTATAVGSVVVGLLLRQNVSPAASVPPNPAK